MGKFSVRTAVIFSVAIFVTLAVTVFLTMAFMLLLFHYGLLEPRQRGFSPLVVPAVVSVIAGFLISYLVCRRPLRSIAQISSATQSVAKGNFDVRLEEHSPITELRDMAVNFNIMTKELAGTEMLRKDFIENVSHEFKTPLAAIEGYATLLQKKDLSPEKRQEYTAFILSNTRRLNTLTGNILLLSRLENQEVEIKKEVFSLDEQIREVILLLERDWTAKDLELDIDLEDVTFTGNRDLLAHVWQNIISNAIKFSPAGGTVHVCLQANFDSAIVTIADQGCGMSEEVQSRIFEKFYQGDASRSTQGNGLGLPLAKRIIDLHGGSIQVESKKDAGTIFTICLSVK